MKYGFLVLILLAATPAFAQEPGSKLYIVPEGPSKTVDGGNKVVTTTPGSFELVFQAALLKEKVPFTLVTDRVQADYTMRWDTDYDTTYTSTRYVLTASLENGNRQVVWADNAKCFHNWNHCAEIIARHLKDTMKHKK